MRRQDRPTHEIPSFDRYLNKVFHFRKAAVELTDSRVAPEISPPTVFLAVFHGFVFRLRQLSAFDSRRPEGCIATRHRGTHGLPLKRNKVFDTNRMLGRMVAALDGIEMLSSYSRCCDSYLERRVKMRHNGIWTEQVQ